MAFSDLADGGADRSLSLLGGTIMDTCQSAEVGFQAGPPKINSPGGLPTMSHQTEAAALFDSGALYGRRTLLRPDVGDPIFIGFKPGAFSIYFGDAPIFHFDREGRWQRAFIDGVHYLKGLDAQVQTIDRVREGENLVLKRKTRSAAEVGDTDALVRALALDLIDGLDAGRFEPLAPPAKGRPPTTAELRAFLERIASWDAFAWSEHRALYLATYGLPPFLPPDCPSPLILQATLGHEGGVAFGGAPALEFVSHDPSAFERHARQVAVLLGARVSQCKTVFLGGPDVLRRPFGDLIAYLETAGRVFPIEAKGGRRHPDPTEETPHTLLGIHAFLDRFGPPLPSSDGWRRCRSLGLSRVCLGVESGAPSVRALYAKHWRDEAFRTLVSELKGAEIGVSLALLVGAGGLENEAVHVEETTALVNALELGPGDLVALLDAREVAGAGRVERPEPLAFTPLSDPRQALQRDELRTRLAPIKNDRKAKVVVYSLEKQGLA